MIYKNYQDMADTIRRNLWKVPQDVDLIVGVPRSGMIPALMIAELLNKRCTDLDTFLEGRETSHGKRGDMMRRGTEGRVLVVDDASFSGRSIAAVRQRLAAVADRHDISYCCVYAEGHRAAGMSDIVFEDVSSHGGGGCLKEWNILHLFRNRMGASMWDIDGLVCKDPPDDRDAAAYEAYLPKALPMVIPTEKVGAFVTYRLEKYRVVTEQWLKGHGVTYGELRMFDAPSRDVRNGTVSSARYKADAYGSTPWAQLFVESDRRQAEKIHQWTGKPVWCYENGRIYQ
jgi:uncharacterized HAD superfamily protein